MLTKTVMLITGLLLAFLLGACSGDGEDIVGRWEFGDQDFGRAYEFYEDGTGVLFSSIDPFYPLVGDFKYTYDPKTGVLKLVTQLGSGERTILNMVSFTSNDEISLEESGMSKPWVFVRKPIPELPAGARARIGAIMLGKKFELLEAKKLEPGWEDEFKDYIVVAKTDIEMIVGQQAAEEWLVKLQVEGNEQETQYVLRKGPKRWGVLELVKQE